MKCDTTTHFPQKKIFLNRKKLSLLLLDQTLKTKKKYFGTITRFMIRKALRVVKKTNNGNIFK